MSGGRNPTELGSREFGLAVACCRYSFRESSAPTPSLPDGLDWSRFQRLAQFHRIEGLAWNALVGNRSSLPPEVANALQSAASRIATDNLHAARECRSLSEAFDDADVRLLILKGLPVGALAYGNPAIKSSVDIDLLIDAADLACASDILSRHGYVLVAPAGGVGRLERWHGCWKESVWRKDRIQIDLHTRTADNSRLTPAITVHSRHQDVVIADGVTLPTLADEELLAYLAVHGASSAWFRLKWIADFGGFLATKDHGTIDRLYRRSQCLGAGRASGQALLLADALFGSLKELPLLAGELRSDAGTLRLFRTALHLLTREPFEPTDKSWGTLPIHVSQLFLLPGLAYKLSEISRQGRQLINRP